MSERGPSPEGINDGDIIEPTLYLTPDNRKDLALYMGAPEDSSQEELLKLWDESDEETKENAPQQLKVILNKPR